MLEGEGESLPSNFKVSNKSESDDQSEDDIVEKVI